MEREVFINDNVVIPDNIMKMSRAERQAEISRLEEEARRERDRIHTKEIVINDNVIILEDIKKMTKEELEKAITVLEKELGLKKKAQPAF